MGKSLAFKVVGAIMSAVATATGLALDIAEVAELQSNWWPLITSALFVFLIGWIIYDLYHQLQRIRNARPSIKFNNTEYIRVKIGTSKKRGGILSDSPTSGYFVSQDMVIDEILGGPCFLRALFANDPESSEGCDAHNVCAYIEYYDKRGSNIIVPSLEGRWAHTSQPGTNNYKPIETSEITMPANGKPRPLDIVMKYDEDEECYAHSNDTPSKAPSDFRDKDRVLGIGEYDLKVRIRGSNNVDETYWFHLVNQGKGKQVQLTTIS